jgi:ADP-ribose pyrophosphatase
VGSFKKRGGTMNLSPKWKILKSEFPINDRWCKIRKDEVELPNGENVKDYFVNVRCDVALILAVTPLKEVIFVHQYRHGVQEVLLELPGGTFESCVENSLEAAARELQEETGYVAKSWTKLATIYDNPVKDTNKIHLIIAENAEANGTQKLDITESVEIILIPIKDIVEKVLKGEIAVSGTISALFLGLKFLNYFDIIVKEV